jgi:hypothetical protein
MSYKLNVKMIEAVGILMRPQLNRLQRLLQEIKGKGTTSVGTSLNGARLTKSYVHALTGQTNSDRYNKRKAKPQTDFAVAIVGDASSSMNAEVMPNITLYHVQNATMIALSNGLTKIGGKVSFGFGHYEGVRRSERVQGAQSEYKPVYYELKDFNQKCLSPDLKRDILTDRAWTGTDVIAYAESACQALLDRQEKHKLAVVLTDMQTTESQMLVLADLAQQYKHRHGITLCFIALAQELPVEIPNACVAYTGDEIGTKVLPFIIEQIKG